MKKGNVQRKKISTLRTILCSMVVALMMAVLPCEAVYAYTNLDVPGVDFAPEGGAWTVTDIPPADTDPDPEHASYWVEKGVEKTTGIPLNVAEPGTGQHAYYYERDKSDNTVTPVYKWVCGHESAMCIHEEVFAGEAADPFHGIIPTDNICGGAYWSGWVPYCADCGQKVDNYFHYISPDKVSQIQYIDISYDYYYMCPHCSELEQGIYYDHDCRAISYNRYAVRYTKNNTDAKGSMGDSLHMYNNETMYEGEEVIPQTHLNKNTFTCTGYEFDCWTTNPDGTGERYEDGAEIFNLTAENYDKDTSDFTGEGIVTLWLG